MQCDLERLKEIFGKMSDNGFDLKNYLKWGFYFFDPEKSKLIELKNELERLGYSFEDLIKMDDKEWRLYVSIIGVLTAEELHKTNLFFNELANIHEVSLYDGWDVEKPPN